MTISSLFILIKSTDAIVIYASVTIIFMVILIAKWKLNRHRRILKKNRKKGEKGEERAVQWLLKRGYKVSEQVSTDEYYRVENKKVTYTIRPDIFATKGNEQWVIEVKTGGAASIGNRDTRRQLREYAASFPDYTLGLFNGDAGKENLQLVEFPKKVTHAKVSFKIIFNCFILGLTIGSALTFYVVKVYI